MNGDDNWATSQDLLGGGLAGLAQPLAHAQARAMSLLHAGFDTCACERWHVGPLALLCELRGQCRF